MFSSVLNSVCGGISSIASSAVGLFSNKSKDPKAEIQSTPPELSNFADEVKPAGGFEKRYLDKRIKGIDVTAYDHELALNTKPILPTPSEHDADFDQSTPPSLIIAEMVARSQNYVAETEEPAKLKFNAVEKKLQKEQKAFKDEQKQIFDKNKAAKQWSNRSRIANYILSGATFLTGGAMLATGIPAGAIMMASSGAAIASQVMSDYDVNPQIVTATSIGSGVLGLVGGASSLYVAPQRFAQGGAKLLEVGAQGLGMLAGAFQTYTGYKQHENLSEAMKVEALHSITETKVKLLHDKLPGVATMFQNTTKSLSNMIKSLAKSHKRETEAVRMAVAAYPA